MYRQISIVNNEQNKLTSRSNFGEISGVPLRSLNAKSLNPLSEQQHINFVPYKYSSPIELIFWDGSSERMVRNIPIEILRHWQCCKTQ